MKKRKKVLIINGPNLNMLKKRNEKHYGSLDLKEINKQIKEENNNFFKLKFFQSNYEGKIIDLIQKSLSYDAIIINPAAFTHTSVAIRDALEMFKGIIIEVHLSDIDSREEYRKISLIKDIVSITFKGEREKSYINAIKYLKNQNSVL